jgi:hypothetical protein
LVTIYAKIVDEDIKTFPKNKWGIPEPPDEVISRNQDGYNTFIPRAS